MEAFCRSRDRDRHITEREGDAGDHRLEEGVDCGDGGLKGEREGSGEGEDRFREEESGGQMPMGEGGEPCGGVGLDVLGRGRVYLFLSTNSIFHPRIRQRTDVRRRPIGVYPPCLRSRHRREVRLPDRDLSVKVKCLLMQSRQLVGKTRRERRQSEEVSGRGADLADAVFLPDGAGSGVRLVGLLEPGDYSGGGVHGEDDVAGLLWEGVGTVGMFWEI